MAYYKTAAAGTLTQYPSEIQITKYAMKAVSQVAALPSILHLNGVF